MLAIRRNPSLMLSPASHTPKQLESIIPNLNQDSKISLRRGKPNTIRTGLRDPTPLRGQSSHRHRNSLPLRDDTPRGTRQRSVVALSQFHPHPSPEYKSLDVPKRAVNRNGSVMKLAQTFAVAPTTTTIESPSSGEVAAAGGFTTPECQWTSGEVLNRHLDHIRIPLTGRPSVQKIRSENVGKVSAHVKKFDRLASPTLLDPRAPPHGVHDVGTAGGTPHRIKSPRLIGVVPRRLSSDNHVVKQKVTSPKVSNNVSPLRESQRVNAVLQSVRTNDVKVVSVSARSSALNGAHHSFRSLINMVSNDWEK